MNPSGRVPHSASAVRIHTTGPSGPPAASDARPARPAVETAAGAGRALKDRPVLDVAAFTSRAGQPRKDVELGLFTWRRSTAYKQLLKQVEAYQALARPILSEAAAPGRDAKDLNEKINQALAELEAIGQAIVQYGLARRHTRTEALRSLLPAVQEEMLALLEIQQSLRQPAGALAPAAAESRATPEPQAAPAGGLAAPALAAYRAEGFTDAQAALLEAARLGLEGGLHLRQAGVPVNERTLRDFAVHQDQQERQYHGAGGFNAVYRMAFGEEWGPHEWRIFKRLPQQERGWGVYTGIDRRDPQTALRNLATNDVADLLGFDVVARTRLGRCLVPLPNQPHASPDDDRLAIGLVMDIAEGEPAADHDADSEVWRNPAVVAQVMRLQLLDHLTAQTDRHGNNFFIHIAPGGQVQVRGIDNDQCFGSLVHDPRTIAHRPDAQRQGFRGAGRPQYIDTGMEAAIQQLTPARLRATLEACALSKYEVNAAVKRLEGLQAHVAQLRRRGRVIDPADWCRPDVVREMRRVDSYIGRRLNATPPRSPDSAEW